MELKLAVYNMEWMSHLFTDDGKPKTSGDDAQRSARLAQVVKAIDPDVLGVVEGPDTTKDGSKTAAAQLRAWAKHHGLDPAYKTVHGFVSSGSQELCALYNSNKLTVKHKPVRDKTKEPFDQPFLVDTTESLIKEYYRHYRPPLELSISRADTNKEVAKAIVAHTKSKGIFDRVDMSRYEQISERNRKKLYAECMSIRERCNQWLKKDPSIPVVVMGDINDGFGMDYYERRFFRSAVDVLLGEVWEPELILTHVLPRPKLKKYGWDPWTSKFTDTITKNSFDVLIDHILISNKAKVKEAIVWNPYLKHEKKTVRDAIAAVREQLKKASDHFPVSALLDI